VIAAAGYGKTTSVAHWAAQQRAAVAWYTIDSYDDRPSVFWRHVAAALARVAPEVPEGDLAADLPEDVAEVTALLSALGADADPLVLVLDDVHLIEDATTLEQLGYFIDRAPEALRVIILGRVRPDLPWGRWAARRQLMEVTEAALAFDTTQCAALLRSTSGTDLTDEVVERLTDAAAGWPAMVALAAHILGRPDRPAERMSESLANDHLVLDFVINEVLEHLDGPDRAAAALMSLLDELDPRRCELLCGVSDGSALLHRLARQGVPMLLLDPVADVWRFHALVRAALTVELERAHDGDLSALHAQVASVERAVDNRPAAVRHLVAAGDTDEAFQIVFAPIADMYRSGSVRAMAQWIDLFPPDFVAASGERSGTFALAMAFLGRRVELERWVRHSRDLDAAPGPALDLELEILLTKTRMLEAVDRGDTDAVRRELAALQERQGTDVLDRAREGGAAVIMAVASWVDDRLDEAADWVEASVRWPDVPERIRAVGQPARAAWVAYLRGSLDDAASTARDALAAGGEVGNISVHAQIELYAVEAALALEWLELDRAASWVDRTLALTEPMHPCLHRFIADRVAFALIEAQRGPDAAAAAAEEAARPAPPHVTVRYELLAAEFEARAGHRAAAARRLVTLPPSARRTLVAARVASLDGDRAGVDATLRDLDGFGEIPRAVRIEAELLRARVSPGSDAVTRALAFGAANGYVWTYLRERDLLDAALRRGIAADGPWQQTRLARARPDAANPAEGGSARLSQGEMRVLRLLASHRSQVEIAKELGVSVNTVKTQVRLVYRKFGVSARSEAVDRARDLGLLTP